MIALRKTCQFLWSERGAIIIAAIIGCILWAGSVWCADFEQLQTVALYSLLATFVSLFVTFITYEVAQSLTSYKELTGVKKTFAEIRADLLKEGNAAKKICKNDQDRIETNIESYYTIDKKKRPDALEKKIKLLKTAADEKRSNAAIADLITQIENLITL